MITSILLPLAAATITSLVVLLLLPVARRGAPRAAVPRSIAATLAFVIVGLLVAHFTGVIA